LRDYRIASIRCSSNAFGLCRGDGDEGGSQTDITQDVKQKQKCKVGNFGDPEDSTSSTTFGFCNQQGQNNFAGGGTLGSAGIPIG